MEGAVYRPGLATPNGSQPLRTKTRRSVTLAFVGRHWCRHASAQKLALCWRDAALVARRTKAKPHCNRARGNKFFAGTRDCSERSFIAFPDHANGSALLVVRK